MLTSRLAAAVQVAALDRLGLQRCHHVHAVARHRGNAESLVVAECSPYKVRNNFFMLAARVQQYVVYCTMCRCHVLRFTRPLLNNWRFNLIVNYMCQWILTGNTHDTVEATSSVASITATATAAASLLALALVEPVAAAFTNQVALAAANQAPLPMHSMSAASPLAAARAPLPLSPPQLDMAHLLSPPELALSLPQHDSQPPFLDTVLLSLPSTEAPTATESLSFASRGPPASTALQCYQVLPPPALRGVLLRPATMQQPWYVASLYREVTACNHACVLRVQPHRGTLCRCVICKMAMTPGHRCTAKLPPPPALDRT